MLGGWRRHFFLLLDNKLSGVRCVRRLEHNYAAPEQGEAARETVCDDDGGGRGARDWEMEHFGCPVHQLGASVLIPSHAEQRALLFRFPPDDPSLMTGLA